MGKLVSLPMNDRKTFVYSQRVCAWDVLNIHHMAAINISIYRIFTVADISLYEHKDFT